MSRQFTHIHYSDTTYIDDVIVAITPIDSFTGRIVRISPKDIELSDSDNISLLKRAIRNHSGRLVFMRRSRIVNGVEAEDEIEKSSYKIKLNAEKAGYFSPPVTPFIPPAANDPDAKTKRNVDIFLHQLPSAQVPSDAIVVRGVINKESKPMAGVKILATFLNVVLPPGQVHSPFEAQSDERGTFTLAIRLPTDTNEEQVNFKFLENGNEREFIKIVNDAKNHSFIQPIELTNSSTPELRVFGE